MTCTAKIRQLIALVALYQGTTTQLMGQLQKRNEDLRAIKSDAEQVEDGDIDPEDAASNARDRANNADRAIEQSALAVAEATAAAREVAARLREAGIDVDDDFKIADPVDDGSQPDLPKFDAGWPSDPEHEGAEYQDDPPQSPADRTEQELAAANGGAGFGS